MAKLIKTWWFWLLVVMVCGMLYGTGYVFYLVHGLPQVDLLDTYRPALTTRLYAGNGEEFAQFSVERRILIPLSAMPKTLKDAVVATEDPRFYTHPGIDLLGISRAALHNIMAGRFAEGGSTITQQLTRALFLTPRKTITRKIREIILAWQIEHRYSKDEILELYLNQIYFGHGAYGVEAAAKAYFDKSASELTLGECAVLAGLPRAPNRYSPLRYPLRALQRRNHVLLRMHQEKLINKQEYKELIADPIRTAEQKGEKIAPYFAEHIRQYLEQKYGSGPLYRDGFKVYTTLDLDLQPMAERALEYGLRKLDKRQGYRPVASWKQIPPQLLSPPDLEVLQQGKLYIGTVEEIISSGLRIRVGKCYGKLPWKQAKWLRSKSPEELFKMGDEVEVKVLGQTKGQEYRFALEQEPEVQGALVTLDPHTGHVLTMLGGQDFGVSKYNRAVQARRQPGSAFKPFVYATALSSGYSLADILIDTPIIFQSGSPKGGLWRPTNYHEKFYGPTTFRKAMEYSRNVVTIRLMEQVGIANTVNTARSLGIKSRLTKDLSLALGSSGLSLLELTSAYGVFANQGERVDPTFIRYITDCDDRLLEERLPKPRQVMSPQIAYLMTSLLCGVVEHGTGWRAKALGRPIAGKTGTTNKCIDAWFIGFTPDMAVGVWVGYDNPRPLGRQETGSKAASPIWVEFMRQALKNVPIKAFTPPEELIRVSIDPDTGRLATPNCPKIIVEDFIRGTEPQSFCHEHSLTADRFLKADQDLSEEEEEEVQPEPAHTVSTIAQRLEFD